MRREHEGLQRVDGRRRRRQGQGGGYPQVPKGELLIFGIFTLQHSFDFRYSIFDFCLSVVFTSFDD